MANRFDQLQIGFGMPFEDFLDVEFDVDLVALDKVPRAVYIGDATGDVLQFIDQDGDTITMSGLVEGSIIEISPVRFISSGTTVAKVLMLDSGSADVAPSGVSPEVQAVFDRMSALTQTEMDAIESFVDGMVAGGFYAEMSEIYAPCLNATDFLTGFKFMSLLPSVTPPVHTPGEFVEFSNNNMHYLDSEDFDTFGTPEGFMGCYNVFTGADTTGNSDLFGLADASNECYYRWRGTDTTDFNAIYNVTTATPRSASNQRPDGDIVGQGLEGLDVFELQPGGIVVKSTRIPTAVPAGHPCQWHGQNLNGTPAAGNMANSRYSLMVHSNVLLSNIVQGSFRALSLQFLRDIGVTGIPAT